MRKRCEPRRVFVGSAGWSIPRTSAARFDGPGTHLQRYGRGLNATEINSSFHGPHTARTYARWAASTPAEFRFAVKMPRAITHDRRLVDIEEPLARFLEQTEGLGEKRGPLLVQLPPSFQFEHTPVAGFFELVRARYEGGLVCEPRHVSWTDAHVDALLANYEVARVAADPPRMGRDDEPGGWPGIVYYRWHGSPRVYWSPYAAAQLDALAARLRDVPTHVEVWCVFDNTASGAAVENAWQLHQRLG